MPAALEILTSADDSVSKYLHADGSETAIKRVLSMQVRLDEVSGELADCGHDRNKYSVFASASRGCYMKCPFCHLTQKRARFRPLEPEEVLANLKAALEHKVQRSPELCQQYIKLSWMGMGDAVNDPALVRYVTVAFLDWVFACGYAKGLDGVDLSTVLPPVGGDWVPVFQALNGYLAEFPANPANAEARQPFRLFYSLHSAVQADREHIVPGAMPLAQAIPLLHRYMDGGAYALVLHHLLIAGLNDSPEAIDAVIDLVTREFPDQELRLLRYNPCATSVLRESQTFVSQVRRLSAAIPRLKVQVSPGSEVSAACGQFIVRNFAAPKR